MIRVMLVDDSAVVRSAFARTISQMPDMQVVGEAPDPFIARDKIVALNPDVIVLDIEMPRMDGLTFLRKLMQHYPKPVVICSSLTVKGGEVALEAMASGAAGVVCKPGPSQAPAATAAELVEAIRQAAASKPRARASAPAAAPAPAAGAPAGPSPAPGHAPTGGQSGPRMGDLAFRGEANQVIAIGASTGGTVAIEEILTKFGPSTPPIVMAQHMPPYITKPFAQRLDRMARIAVREATDGEELAAGTALLAPGGFHLVVEKSGRGWRARVKDGPLVSGHRPSVDVLFRSVAAAAGERAVGVLLTGMGADGAKGLLAMRQAGARTMAEHESTCVVYGMPRVAIETGAAAEAVPLPRVASAIMQALERGATRRAG